MGRSKATKRSGSAAHRSRRSAFERLEARRLLAATLFRVNAGGPEIAASPAWAADTESAPSQYVNAAETGNATYSKSKSIDMSDLSIPTDTPAELFQTERWDGPSDPEMQWSFPVTPGSYEVRLYFAEIYGKGQSEGARVFDVSIEDQLKLDNYDIFAEVGGYAGVMKSFLVSSDESLDIQFGREVENPAIKAIEVLSADHINQSPALDPIDDQSVATGDTVSLQVTASDPDTDQNLALELDGLPSSMTTFTDHGDGTATVTLSPEPEHLGTYTGSITVTDDAGDASLSDTETFAVAVSQTGIAAAPLYRVNSGGKAVSASDGDWANDTSTSPSAYVNAAETGNTTYSKSKTIDLSDPSVPAGTPMELFQTERWDGSSSPEMQWSFPVTAGDYEVRLYFAEIYGKAQAAGARVFDVSIENQLKLNDYDVFADVGGYTGVMKSFLVTSDDSLDVLFGHETDNPAIKAIEILPTASNTAPVLDPIGNQSVDTGETLSVSVTASDADTDQKLTFGLEGLPSFATLNDHGDGTATLTLSPQAQDVGSYSGTITVTDDAGSSSLSDSETFTVEVVATPLYRVNSGGALVAADVDWTADTELSPSQYVNATETGNKTYSTAKTVDLSDASVPTGTPMELFQSERWDGVSAPEMQWSFPVTPGAYEVRLFFAEISDQAQAGGARVFDVTVEDQLKLDDYDIFAEVGGYAGVMKSILVTSDDMLDVQFGHEVENPALKAIEILPAAVDNHAPVLEAVGSQSVAAGETLSISVAASDVDPGQSLSFELDGLPTSFTSFTDHGDGTATVTLSPQAEHVGTYSGTITVTDDAESLPLSDSETFSVEVLQAAGAPTPLYRVNSGGDLVAAEVDWAADSEANPSPYVNAAETGNKTFSTGATIDTSHASIPAGTPSELFQHERWDGSSAPEMQWSFPVTPGQYEVRLYFAETYSQAQAVGARVFDASIEGELTLDNYDIFADVGGYKAVMKSFVVDSDDSLNILFGHEVDNPAIKAIEIVTVQQSDTLLASATSVDFGTVDPGSTSTQSISLSNGGAAGDPDIEITGATISGDSVFSVAFASALPVTLAPGESVGATVEFLPTAGEAYSGTLAVAHSGVNSPLNISLSGEGTSAPINFGKSALSGTALGKPTSLQFGPDGRLYVAEQNGKIFVYTVSRNAANDFTISDSELITSVQNIPNHNDDGTVNTSVNKRLITGLLVAGTATNPVIYVGSSDPRIGAGSSGEDLNLDTNSGIISRLTWNGSSWEKVDLVRGLPRSEENHTNNGMQLDESTNTLYVAMGGNTNMGAPSNNFALLPEYALSAAILSIDLDAIGDTTYDLPTLDDEDRANATDADGNTKLDATGTPIDPQDPFGGNDGKNQAKLVPGGPVQVFSPGWRNPYDIVIAGSGKMYSIDNGSNGGWGDVPILNEDGVATNEVNEPGVTHGDGLHLIEGPGFYAGHPNPTRASQINTFNESNPQSPVSEDNQVESHYIAPADDSLVVFGSSTNGLTEYTASNFSGELQGNLLAVSYDNSVKRIVLNVAGDQVVSAENLFSNVGSLPLDVTAIGEQGAFPGTIWVADYIADQIVVFEPQESSGGCENDDDCDGYTNDDEIANGSDPNNASDVPADFDEDFVSDLLDDDDDNDAILDLDDAFAIDAANGTTTPIGTNYTWENDSSAGGLLNLGFTGLMKNGADDYLDLYDPEKLTAGGAAGVLTVDAAGAGTALGTENSQQQAFQFGFDAASADGPFQAQSSVIAPFAGLTPEAGTEMGFYTGTGDQDNYAKLVISGDGGGAIHFVIEENGVATTVDTDNLSLSDVDFINLDLTVDPATQEIVAQYQVSRSGTLAAPVQMDQTGSVPATWLEGAMAVGVISTDATPVDSPVSVTWDHLGVISPNPQGIAPSARVTVNEGGGIDASTYPKDSIWVENIADTGGPRITSVTFNTSTTMLPDIIFDPAGTGGDTDAKPLKVTTGADTTGFVAPDDPAADPFSVPYQKGYRQMTMDFTHFDVGEVVKFAVDIDPSTIQGLAGQGTSWPGSISGLEMSGMTITVNFADGSSHTGTLFATAGSKGEGRATIAPASPAAPTIEVLGLTANPVTVSQPEQTVRVSGNPGETVRLLLTESALEPIDQELFDVDPYEANRVKAVKHYSGVIPAGSDHVDFDVTLTNNHAQGGINHLVAVIDSGTRTGSISEVLVIQLDESATTSTTVGVSGTSSGSPDVNADGTVSSLDALVVINTLNRQSLGSEGEFVDDPLLDRADVNRDGQITALDALNVINYLNRQTAAQDIAAAAEGEDLATGIYPPVPEDDDEEEHLLAVDTAIEMLYPNLD